MEKKKFLSQIFVPEEWGEVLGQDHLIGPSGPLRVLVEKDNLRSCIFYGPPGCGKTTVARIISGKTKRPFFYFNASINKPKEIQNFLENLRTRRVYFQEASPICYIDEIFRFPRQHQEILLWAIDEGKIIFIGSTVLNPYFYISKSLLSRSLVFEFKPLGEKDLVELLKRALNKFYSDWRYEEEALWVIARASDGDARRSLNLLEACLSVIEDKLLSFEKFENLAFLSKSFIYDKKGDEHYGHISLLIKSIRGSDPDASVYYLVKMLRAGEDPRYILRRLLILASEDIGLKEPLALIFAEAAASAFERVGMPEGELILTHLVLFLSILPKSNVVLKTLRNAEEVVERGPVAFLPEEIKKGHGYLYTHDYPHIKQEFLPPNLRGLKIFPKEEVEKDD